MTAYRDCPEARWFPSRYRFALPRLIAYVRSGFPTRPRADVDHIMLTIDRDQTVGEQYPISVWMLASVTCYVAAVLPVRWWPVAPFIAIVLMQLTIVSVGIIGPLHENHLHRTSMSLFGLMFIASAWFAMSKSPVRYVAWFFLGIAGLNAMAFLVMIALRKSVRQLERRCEP